METETQILSDTPRGRLRRRAVFATVGLTQGIVIYLLGEFGGWWFQGRDAVAAITLFAALAAPIWCLGFNQGRRFDAAIFAVSLSAILALLLLWMESRIGLDRRGLGRLFWIGLLSSAAIGYIALPFFQTWQETRHFRFPYAKLFGHAWSNFLTVLAAGIFVAALWLLLWLWASLFRLVDIQFFGDMFKTAWFAKSVTGLAFALGVALLREHERIVQSLQALVFALKLALAPILPTAAVLFLLLLPFAGLETLWRTGHATTILLFVVAIGIVLANTVARDSSEAGTRSPMVLWPVAALLVLTPVFIGLAFYATGLRIVQHGLTPERVYAVAVIFALGVYAVVYSYAVIRRRRGWDVAIRDFNPVLALIVAGIIVVLMTPIADPYRISAWEQSARLTGGRTDPAAFDYGYLKHRLGAPGKEALESIRSDSGVADRKVVSHRLSLLDKGKNYGQWKAALRRDQRSKEVNDFGLLLDYIQIVPDGTALPSGFETFLRQRQPSLLQWCYKMPIDRCAVIVAELTGDDTPETVVVRNWGRSHVQFEAYRNTSASGWRSYDRWSARAPRAQEVWQQIKKGNISTTPPQHKFLRLGEVTVPLTPRR